MNDDELKTLVEAVRRLYRQESDALCHQRDNSDPITPLGVADIENRRWLDSEIEDVDAILEKLEAIK